MNETFDDKIMEATAIADAISTIVLCVQHTDVDIELHSGVADVLFGIRKLAEMLNNKLNEASCDSLRKDGEAV